MKIAYYCQHVLGIGHFHRSLEISYALSKRHDVTMIVGGPDVPVKDRSISIIKLPALKMDEQFKNLEPCDNRMELEYVKRDRRRKLLNFITDSRPDCLVIELYPFGRKAFRFELDPLLTHLQETNKQCKIYCSLRDILVEKKEGREKFEQRAVTTLNSFFNGLLIHADKEIIRLHDTFGKTASIEVPLHYTGFISPKPSVDARKTIRKDNNISESKKLIVTSIGGGNVGKELLFAVVEAVSFLKKQDNNIVLQIFTGPYFDDHSYNNLVNIEKPWLKVSRFSDNFIDWLSAADLSISMAGYNTSMNCAAAEIPALMYPFSQNHEQKTRVNRLFPEKSVGIIEKSDFEPEILARLIKKKLQQDYIPPKINLDGAEQTVRIIEAG